MNCFYHKDRVATATCRKCGRELCSECASLFSPTMCADCAGQIAAENKAAMTKNIAISILLMIAGIVIIQNPMGFLLAGIPSGWRFLNRITPSMFLWMPLVGWIIYFFIKLTLSYFIGLFVLPVTLIRNIKAITDAKKVEEYLNRR